MVNGQRIPVQAGTVAAQLRKVDNRCQIDAPVAVGGASRNGEPVYSISWHLDDQCRMVITEVAPVTGGANRPPSGGSTRRAEAR